MHFHYDAEEKNCEVTLRVELRGTLAATCARCCEPVVKDFSIEKEYRITARDLEEEFPELPYTAEGNLDLEEFAYGELVLETDTIQLCREDCEGLCQRCGQPVRDCDCPDEPAGDPRLQVLRQLLNEEDDEPN